MNLGAMVGMVLATIRTFSGRRVISQSTDDSGDYVEVEFEKGEPRRAEMPPEVYLAYMNSQVRQAARRAVAPVERPGIESVTLRTTGGE